MKQVLELIHADLCGPISPSTIGGNKYFLLLVYNFSRFMWIYLLASKDETFEAFKRFQAGVERDSEKKIKVLGTIRVASLFQNNLQIIVKMQASLDTSLRPTLHNKTEWLSARIELL